jgi:hypothetical protein
MSDDKPVEAHGGPTIYVVETDDGWAIREVEPLSPLEGDPGPAAEEAASSAALEWGLPDFLYLSRVVADGSGIREIGDRVICVGDSGAVVQVKAREAASADATRERSWLDKRISKATKQAHGTIRKLRARDTTTLTNHRGRDVDLPTSRVDWAPVVVLDHPGFGGYVPDSDAIVLLRSDWNFLFDQLKSTHAVLQYLHRIKDMDPVALGSEPTRYFDLAQIDAATPPAVLPEALLRPGAEQVSAPLLPVEPITTQEREAHSVLRVIAEEVATMDLPGDHAELDRLAILSALDSMPVSHRTRLGRTMLSWLEMASQTPENTRMWKTRSIVGDVSEPHLLVAATNKHGEDLAGIFGTYVSLRHQQLLETGGTSPELMTVGVLLVPDETRRWGWSTYLFATRGEQHIDPEIREVWERVWGKPGER